MLLLLGRITVERGKLEAFLELNWSTRKIANKLGRHHSTIAREIKRNTLFETGFYNAEEADVSRVNRRLSVVRPSKITPEDVAIIEEKLEATWSPEQIANRIFSGRLCFKTIYRLLYEGKIAKRQHAVFTT